MKIKVTLLTENDKHLDKSKEEIEELAKRGWNFFCADYNVKNPSERVTLEKLEVVEL